MSLLQKMEGELTPFFHATYPNQAASILQDGYLLTSWYMHMREKLQSHHNSEESIEALFAHFDTVLPTDPNTTVTDEIWDELGSYLFDGSGLQLDAKEKPIDYLIASKSKIGLITYSHAVNFDNRMGMTGWVSQFNLWKQEENPESAETKYIPIAIFELGLPNLNYQMYIVGRVSLQAVDAMHLIAVDEGTSEMLNTQSKPYHLRIEKQSFLPDE